jgi:glycosyl transferase, family 25
VILWSWNFDSYLFFDWLPGVSPCLASFDQDKLRTGLDAFQRSDLAPKGYRLMRAFGLVCYSVTPAGARKLHQQCLPIKPMSIYFPGLNRTLANMQVDYMTNDLYPRINAYVCFPPLAVTENDHVQSDTVVRPATAQDPVSIK